MMDLKSAFLWVPDYISAKMLRNMTNISKEDSRVDSIFDISQKLVVGWGEGVD